MWKSYNFTSSGTDPSWFQTLWIHRKHPSRQSPSRVAGEMPGPWQGWSPADPTTRPVPAQSLGRSTPGVHDDEGRGDSEEELGVTPRGTSQQRALGADHRASQQGRLREQQSTGGCRV